MSRCRTPLAVAATAVLALCVLAPAASATFHLVQVREVYPGSAASPGSEYVELQMWAGGQDLVKGHVVRTYDKSGAVTGTDAFPSDGANGANQSTLLLATPEAEAELGFVADGAMSPSGRLDPDGGAVCWEALDCVSWGSFSGSLPSPAGPPAGSVPDGMALRRSIAAGCPSSLDANDDHDNSAADFSPVFPDPRPNSVPPTERPCGGTAGGGGGAGSGGAGAGDTPRTLLRGKPPKRSRDRTPTFRFGADQGGAKFECRIDKRPFRSCKSPYTSKPLPVGGHVFKVRARDDSGATDPSPAVYAFKVLPPR